MRNAEKNERSGGREEEEERKGGRDAHDGVESTSIQSLQDRLSMSEEWNRRLHHELQALLQLPPVDLQAWRERMESVEVSLPLLQRYDAMLDEKEEHISELEGRIRQLHTEVEEYLSREQDFQQDDMLRKGLLEKVKSQAEEEVGNGKNKLRELQRKYDDLERELRRAVETAQEEAHRAGRAQEDRRTVEQTLEQLTREKKDLEETVENLRRGEQHRRATDKEEALEKEALHVQLQVLLRQREEMKKEVEQVRHKMIHSIRQAGENHAAHLRVVEERHRTALEDQRQVNRTHEMEILKLRAQLARMDPNASAIGGGMCGNPSATSAGGSGSPRRGGMSSTSALLEAQTLQAQDIEIKRLYADLGHAQRQRDEALDRWHELSERMDEKERGWMDDHRREEQSLQQRLHEVRSQLDRKDGECTRLQRVVSEYKDRQRQLEDGQSELRQARDQLQEELAEQKKMLTEKDHILRHVQEDQDRYHGQEVERQARLEQRVEAVLEELRQSRNKSIADLQNVERERDTMRTQLQEGKKQLVAVQQMVAQRDREKEVMEIQMSKLLEGLSKHKNELLFTDNRLLELQRGKEEVERQQRINVLAMEHLKLENARLQQQLRRPL